MLGFVLIIVITWQIYKTANENGHNGIAWAAGTFFGSFILQFMIGVAMGLFYGIGMELWGWTEDGLNAFSWLISITAMAVNLLAIWLVFRYLSRVPETGPYMPPPPPPANFS